MYSIIMCTNCMIASKAPYSRTVARHERHDGEPRDWSLVMYSSIMFANCMIATKAPYSITVARHGRHDGESMDLSLVE